MKIVHKDDWGNDVPESERNAYQRPYSKELPPCMSDEFPSQAERDRRGDKVREIRRRLFKLRRRGEE